MKHKQEKIGEVYAFLVLAVHSIWPAAVHYGASELPQLQFLATMFLAGAVLFLVTTLWRGELHQLWNKRIVGWLLLYTLPFMTLPYAIMVYATRFSSAINTALLIQTEAIFAAILGALLLGERISWRRGLGIFFIFVASVAILYDGSFSFGWADLSLALLPALFVCANIIAKKLQTEGLSWSPLLLFRSVVGGLTLLGIVYFFEGFEPVSAGNWLFMLTVGLGVFGLGKILWQLALGRLDVSKVTAIIMVQPLFSVGIAYLWLAEVPSLYQWIGVILSGFGVIFLMKTHSKQWVELD